MTSLYRVRATWTGFAGAPGVSTFYGLVEGALPPRLPAFFTSIVGYLPADVDVQVENTGDIIEDTTGVLTGAWAVDPMTPVHMTGAGPYPALAGAKANWLTETILDGHRVKGRTFIVPICGSQFDDDGTLSDGILGDLGDAATLLAADSVGDMVIWHRPRAARAAYGTHPALSARAGGHALVIGANVPDKATVLRSRRD